MKIRTVRRSLAVATTATLVALGSVAFAAPAAAAIFEVDTEAELVAAIHAANGNLEADTINIIGASFTLTADLPAITTDIAFVGPGSGVFTLDGASMHDAFILQGVVGTPINVSFTGISITEATWSIQSNQANVELDDLHVESIGVYHNDGNLSIVDSVIENTAGNGLAVEVFGSQAVSIDSSSFNTNGNNGIDLHAEANATVSFTDVEADFNEGGIQLFLSDDAELTATRTIATDSSDGHTGIELALSDDSTAVLTDSTVTGNDGDGFQIDTDGQTEVTLNTVLASDNGDDGLDLSAVDDGVIVVNDATATSNEDGVDAFVVGSDARLDLLRLNSSDNDETGLYLRLNEGGTVNVTASQIRRNLDSGVVASTEGAVGTLNITTTTIDSNEAELGGGILIDPMEEYEVTITDSTISNNESSVAGAGIFAALGADSELSIINSTVSGNNATEVGAIFVGNVGEGEGVSESLIIAHSTITDNESTDDAPVVTILGIPTTIHHSIIADNLAPGSPADIELDSSFSSIDYSLIGDPDAGAEAYTDAGTGNIVGFSANLGPLANNGGLTLTHLPLATSRALEAGNPAVAGAPVNDQRGVDRVIGVIEIGAVEVEAILPATGADPGKSLIGGIIALGFGMLLLAGAAWRKSRAFL